MKHTKEIVEVCPYCGIEVEFKNIPVETKHGKCPECKHIVHFCDECMFNHGEDCNPLDPTSYCHEYYIQPPIGFKDLY